MSYGYQKERVYDQYVGSCSVSKMGGITLGEVLIRLSGLARYFYMVLEQEVLRWIIPPVKQLDLVLFKWIKL